MDNGFLIQITNKSNEFKQVYLFSNELPEGVDIQTLNGSYDFNALHKTAINQPFAGNSITSNYSSIIQLEIINDGVGLFIKCNFNLRLFAGIKSFSVISGASRTRCSRGHRYAALGYLIR